MRTGIANPGSSNYFNIEVFLNQLKQVSINSGTERALAVVLVDGNGATLSNAHSFAVIDHATTGDNTIVSANATKKIRVTSLFLVSSGTVNVRFESGAGGTALTGQMNLVANTGFALNYNPAGWFETGVNALLNLELSGNVSVDGALTYIEV